MTNQLGDFFKRVCGLLRIYELYLIVVTDVEPKAEKDVIPNEHLHLWILSRIDSHHVSIDDGNRSPSRG